MVSRVGLLLCVCLGWVSLAASQPAPVEAPAAPPDLPPEERGRVATRIDSMLTRWQRADAFSGVVLVAQGSRVMLQKAYGLADRQRKTPHTPATGFLLGSMARTLTAMLVLELVDRDKLDLDGSIREYLPEYDHERAEAITLRRLLTHTAGLPGIWTVTRGPGEFEDGSAEDGGSARQRYGAYLASLPLEGEPGASYRHSNVGYELLALACERVTGKGYEDALRELVLRPVGMLATGSVASGVTPQQRAQGYARRPGGFDAVPPAEQDDLVGSGSIYSTVSDLWLLDHALRGERLLPAGLRDAMLAPDSEGRAMAWDVFMVPSAEETPLRIDSTSGSTPGFSARLERAPAEAICVVLLSNVGGGIDPLLADAVLSSALGQQGPLPEVPLIYAYLRAAGRMQSFQREMQARRAPDLEEWIGFGRRLKQYDLAADSAALFELLAGSHPGSWEVQVELAESYMWSGEAELARKHFRKSLELNPDNPRAEFMLLQLDAGAE
jgi:CubicO group peptidase (beta-lactamase class C family)